MGRILIDGEGKPTTDPGAMYRQPRGALTTFGEHKGYALAFVCEMLAGALFGSGTMRPERQDAESVTNGMLTIVIDPARLTDQACMNDEIAAMVHQWPARLAGLATSPRLRPLLDQLIGPGSRMVQDMALLKPPFHGAEKPWHQDHAYWNLPLDAPVVSPELVGVRALLTQALQRDTPTLAVCLGAQLLGRHVEAIALGIALDHGVVGLLVAGVEAQPQAEAVGQRDLLLDRLARVDGGRALVLDHVARQQMAPVRGGVEHDIGRPTLDAALANQDRTRVRLVKLDLEGAEYAALQGAPSLLREVQPDFLVELEPEHLARQGTSAADVVGLFEKQGYRFFTVDGNGPEGVRLTPEIEMTLYRVAQEALANVRAIYGDKLIYCYRPYGALEGADASLGGAGEEARELGAGGETRRAAALGHRTSAVGADQVLTAHTVVPSPMPTGPRDAPLSTYRPGPGPLLTERSSTSAFPPSNLVACRESARR